LSLANAGLLATKKSVSDTMKSLFIT